jgi:hypothetical protein
LIIILMSIFLTLFLLRIIIKIVTVIVITISILIITHRREGLNLPSPFHMRLAFWLPLLIATAPLPAAAMVSSV